MYSTVGRPSIPPERLLKASLLMALYTVRGERLLCEQLDYNFLFRWFLDLEADEASFDHSTFSRNRARLLEHEVAGEVLRAVGEQARGLKCQRRTKLSLFRRCRCPSFNELFISRARHDCWLRREL